MKILVIQQKMIGDVLISSILCQALKQQHPDASVDYLINSNTMAVVENNPWIDHLVEFLPEYKSSKRALLRFARHIRNKQYDVVIDVYSKPESNLVSLFSGANMRVSYDKWYSRWIYTHTHRRLPASASQRAYYNRLKLIEPIVPDAAESTVSARIYITDKEQQAAAGFLRQHGVATQPQRPLMINILGSGASKSYPADHMAELLDRIARLTDAPLLLNYIPAQQPQVDAIVARCQPATQQQLCSSATAASLRDFLALLTQCSALIGNEGGAVHMAQALQLPTFAIFSPWVAKSEWQLQQDAQHQAVHVGDFRPELISGVKTATLKDQADSLYRELRPELLQPQLTRFIQQLGGSAAEPGDHAPGAVHGSRD